VLHLFDIEPAQTCLAASTGSAIPARAMWQYRAIRSSLLSSA